MHEPLNINLYNPWSQFLHDIRCDLSPHHCSWWHPIYKSSQVSVPSQCRNVALSLSAGYTYWLLPHLLCNIMAGEHRQVAANREVGQTGLMWAMGLMGSPASSDHQKNVCYITGCLNTCYTMTGMRPLHHSTHMYAHMHTHTIHITNIRTQMYTHTLIYTHTHMHACTRTRAHTHTRTHSHTWPLLWRLRHKG